VRLAALVQRHLAATNDPRPVLEDVHARYFGAVLKDDTLLPGPNPRLGKIAFDAWFRQAKPAR